MTGSRSWAPALPAGKILVKDRIADSMFQQVLLRPDEYDVLATPNLNGDYLSDACAAQVGGLGMAPGANIGDEHGVFEATHGTAPKYADLDVINPSSVILSGAMMFEYMGWKEVGDADRAGHHRDHPPEARHLRSAPPDGRRGEAEDQRIRRRHRREHGRPDGGCLKEAIMRKKVTVVGAGNVGASCAAPSGRQRAGRRRAGGCSGGRPARARRWTCCSPRRWRAWTSRSPARTTTRPRRTPTS